MPARSTRLSVLSAVALASALIADVARAEPTGAQRAMAEALFRDARQLITAGKVAEACARFAESQRLDPQLGTLINLALCHEQQGKTASAWGELNEATAMARRLKQADREKFARARAAAIEPALSRVVITGAADAGIRLTIDGQALGVSAMGAPLPIDPGEHVVAAEAPGKKRWELGISIPPGPQTTPIKIPALEDAPLPPPSLPPPPPPPAPILAPPPVVVPPVIVSPPPPEGPNGARVAGIVIGSLGLAGLVAGSVLGGLAFSREADARNLCPDIACPTQEGVDLHDTAARFATASTVAFVAGGVAAVGGVVLLVISRDKPAPASAWNRPASAAWNRPASAGAWIVPWPGGVAIGGRF